MDSPVASELAHSLVGKTLSCVDHRIGYWNIRIVTGELGQVCFCFTTAVFEIHPATYGY